MKRNIALIAVLLSILVGLAKPNNIYVYRNDGAFNAFFADEVDSIYYSKFDLNDKEHGEYVTQVIATKDSSYRIPLAVVDSISYITPPNILNKKVVKLDEGYLEYIKSHTDSTLTISNSLPSELELNVNDILFYEEFDTYFPNGFAGKIKKISRRPNSIYIECSPVFLTDIYDSYVSVGEYVITPDQTRSNKYCLAPQRVSGEIPLSLTIPLNFGYENLEIGGEIKWGPKIRLVARINDKSQYLEFTVINIMHGNLTVHGGGSISYNYIDSNPRCISVPIPQMPLFKLAIELSPFLRTSLEGETKAGVSMSSEGRFSIIFENGKWRTERPAQTGTAGLTDELSLTGSFWGGLYARFELSTVRDMFDIGLDTYVGPRINANINLDFIKNIDSSRLYDALKNSKAKLGLRAEAGFSSGYKISKTVQGRHDFVKFCPALDFGCFERYLLPDFERLNIKLEGTSAMLATRVSRSLLFPCQIGIALLDNESNRTNYLHPSSYIAEDLGGIKITHTFKDLDLNGKYKAFPYVKNWGLVLDASPVKEFDMFAYVYTGNASASYTEAQVWGGFELRSSSDSFQPSEFGICYSNYNANPTCQDSSSSIGISVGDGNFKNEIFSLAEGTTYYYRAYVRFGEKYYYGSVNCFTTKKHEVPEEDDDDKNTGGISEEDGETPPVATTIATSSVSKRSATIQLKFTDIIPGTDCGYFLEGNGDNSELQMISLGTVVGNISIPLSNLKPGTTYTFQAYARNKFGKSFGDEKTFKTTSEPAPSTRTVSVDNVTDKTADITCFFSNLPEGVQCGVEVTTSSWSYLYSCPAKEGESKKRLSNLEPSANYTVATVVNYDGETVYGNDISFTTKLREIPDLSGQWTFNQEYLGNHTVHPKLKLKSKGDDYATYTASDFYGVIRFEMTVYSDLHAEIKLFGPNSGANGRFYGEFDEEFTRILGSTYIYDPGPENWALPPFETNGPWCLSR